MGLVHRLADPRDALLDPTRRMCGLDPGLRRPDKVSHIPAVDGHPFLRLQRIGEQRCGRPSTITDMTALDAVEERLHPVLVYRAPVSRQLVPERHQADRVSGSG